MISQLPRHPTSLDRLSKETASHSSTVDWLAFDFCSQARQGKVQTLSMQGKPAAINLGLRNLLKLTGLGSWLLVPESKAQAQSTDPTARRPSRRPPLRSSALETRKKAQPRILAGVALLQASSIVQELIWVVVKIVVPFWVFSHIPILAIVRHTAGRWCGEWFAEAAWLFQVLPGIASSAGAAEPTPCWLAGLQGWGLPIPLQ